MCITDLPPSPGRNTSRRRRCTHPTGRNTSRPSASRPPPSGRSTSRRRRCTLSTGRNTSRPSASATAPPAMATIKTWRYPGLCFDPPARTTIFRPRSQPSSENAKIRKNTDSENAKIRKNNVVTKYGNTSTQICNSVQENAQSSEAEWARNKLATSVKAKTTAQYRFPLFGPNRCRSASSKSEMGPELLLRAGETCRIDSTSLPRRQGRCMHATSKSCSNQCKCNTRIIGPATGNARNAKENY
jgi:hypothetical protein